MDRRDRSLLGEEIANLVESALESCDFKKLSQSMERTVNQALNQVGKNVSQAGKIIQDSIQKEFTSKPGQREQEFGRQAEGGEKHSTQEAKGQGNAQAPFVRAQDRFAKSGGMKGMAVVMMGLGLGLLAFFGVDFCLSLVGAVTGTALGLGEWFALGALGFLTAAGVFLGGAGLRLWGYTQRFKGYVARLEGREYCEIEDLQEISGKSRKYILRDLKRMIRDKLFKQGHLDRQGTCLMVTDAAYEQYQAALKSLKQRQQAENCGKAQTKVREQENPEGEEQSQLSRQAKKVIQDGNQYLEQIRRSNEAIAGAEISRKISRMELVIGKIFERVEQHPDLIEDLGRFMDYYLPTTVKLLGAYEEMDAQPVQGPNIVNSKKEIADTLDIINQAFENLLDSFFEDTAWDISTDISVFKTMLAQEGLTESDFARKGK